MVKTLFRRQSVRLTIKYTLSGGGGGGGGFEITIIKWHTGSESLFKAVSGNW